MNPETLLDYLPIDFSGARRAIRDARHVRGAVQADGQTVLRPVLRAPASRSNTAIIRSISSHVL